MLCKVRDVLPLAKPLVQSNMINAVALKTGSSIYRTTALLLFKVHKKSSIIISIAANENDIL